MKMQTTSGNDLDQPVGSDLDERTRLTDAQQEFAAAVGQALAHAWLKEPRYDSEKMPKRSMTKKK